MANIPGAVTDASRVRGETIDIKSGGDTIKGYLAHPSQSGRYPGIVVIHEAFGLVEHIRDIARRFANIGCNALAPDLYSRKGGPSDPNDINTVFPVMFGKSDAEAVQDLDAAAAHLRGLSGATGKIGAIGFCSGGRQTLLFACSSDKVDAAVDCWGGFIHRATPDAETTPSRPTPILNLSTACIARSSLSLARRTRTRRWRQSEELRTWRSARARTSRSRSTRTPVTPFSRITGRAIAKAPPPSFGATPRPSSTSI